MDPIATAEWLHSQLSAGDTVVLDATLPPPGLTPVPDVRARYESEHIPGAIFFDIEALSDHTSALPHMLPTPEEFGRSMSALGVGSGMKIVVYEQESVFSAPRAWWMLRSFGARSVYVLDGGLRAWRAAGYPVETGVVHRQPAHFPASLAKDAVVSLADLKSRLKNHGQVLDARSAGRFNGTAPEPRPGLPSGHMPGATNIPFTELVDAGRFKTPDALHEVFAAHAVDISAPITTSCGSGVTAAVLALGLERCGATQVSLYDGSWTEYAGQPDAVIESQHNAPRSRA